MCKCWTVAIFNILQITHILYKGGHPERKAEARIMILVNCGQKMFVFGPFLLATSQNKYCVPLYARNYLRNRMYWL